MKWIITAIVLLLAAFVGRFLQTGEIWDAMNAAGIVSLVYVVGLLYSYTRPPTNTRQRWIVISVAGLLILGVAVHWITMYTQTRWQYITLHTIHKTIFHGIVSDNMHGRAIRAFSEFHTQSEKNKKSLGEIFQKGNPLLHPEISLLDTGSAASEGIWVYVASISDSEIVLIGQALFIDGEDPSFQNFTGKRGMTQDRLRLNTQGIFYEIQN